MGLFVRDSGFYKRLITIAVPITLQGLINIGVNMVDTMMLGNLNQDALSASALANQFCMLFMILNFGLGGGASVLTGQFWGKGDKESIGKTLSIVYKITAALAALFFVAAQFFPESVMSLYTNEANLIKLGASYLKIVSWAFLLQGFSTITAIVLRTVGVVRLTLITSTIALVNNFVMNYAFIYGNFGAPRMDIAGAALATAISRLFEFIIIAVFILRIDKKIQFRLKSLLSMDKPIFVDYLKNGLPVLVSDLILALGFNVLAAIMGRIGGDFVAANAIANTVWQFTTVFLMGTSAASSVIIGNTVGARRYEDAQRYAKTFLALAVIIGLLAGVVVFLLRDAAVALFGTTLTEAARQINRQLMSAISLLAVFSSVQMMLTKGVLRAGGDTRFLMVADVLFLWLVSVPLGYTAGLVLHLVPILVLLCLKIDEIIKAVWCTFRLFSGKWIRNVTVLEGHGEEPAFDKTQG